MTQLATPPTTPTGTATPSYASPGTGRPRPRRNQRRGGIAVVMAASLALSAGTRFLADTAREAALPRRGEAAVSNTSLSNMNSFALGLLLGGLRGPLVMILWTDSENQKTAKNLEGVDTEIEWIRLLQPEFDTVHLFQIWNKAYNISVQMASLANKYDTILGALDYAHSVDRQKPDDINIIAAVGQLYFDKLGTSAEKGYYRPRVRAESMPHAIDAAARRADVGWRRVTLDPVVGADGRIVPEARADLAWLAKDRYEPYTDGVSTFAFAYNYYKRSEQLMNNQHQHHDQLSDLVIDSRPGLSLKNWADDEVEQAGRREAQALGMPPVPPDAVDVGGYSAPAPPTAAVADPAALAQAVADYDRATRLIEDALGEYRRHIQNVPSHEQQYKLYMDEIGAETFLAAGDRDYLRALAAPAGPGRTALLAAAQVSYGRAVVGYDRILLRYYTDGAVLAKALPPGYAALPVAGQKGVDELPPDLVFRAEDIADRAYQGPRDEDPQGDRFEYLRHVRRAIRRIRAIGQLAGPTTR